MEQPATPVAKRNLIIIHRGPDYERDFDEIAVKVNALDRDITVYHLPDALKVELPVSAWQYPTLTVSLCSKFRLPVRRGPVLKNYQIGKLAQQELFRDLRLDPADKDESARLAMIGQFRAFDATAEVLARMTIELAG